MAASEMNASAMSASAASRRDRPGEIREKMDGARAIVRTLAELGVDVVFGLPGGAILPTYDPM